MKYSVAILSIIAAMLISTAASSQVHSEEISAEKKKLYELFEQKMSGVKLVGQFTILGKEQNQLPKEEYTIKSVKKAPQGEQWLFETNIKYGDKDVTVPLPIDVEWAGKTPVITLTDFTIPGMGTFSSRVVIYKSKYAGTWTHGDVGGHLFGTIEKWNDPAATKSRQD